MIAFIRKGDGKFPCYKRSEDHEYLPVRLVEDRYDPLTQNLGPLTVPVDVDGELVSYRRAVSKSEEEITALRKDAEKNTRAEILEELRRTNEQIITALEDKLGPEFNDLKKHRSEIRKSLDGAVDARKVKVKRWDNEH